MARLSKEAKEAKTHDSIRAMIWSATQRFAKDNKYDVADPTDTRSEKKKAMQRIAETHHTNTGSDTYVRPFLSMYEILTGEPFTLSEYTAQRAKGTIASPELVWTRHAAVIPVVNDNANSYPLEKIVIFPFGEKKSGIVHDGSYGNSLSGKKSAVRPATVEELLTITKYQYATLLREFFVQI